MVIPNHRKCFVIFLLQAAHSDSQGITAAFNKNLLHRINRELYANFQVERFTHYAFFNSVKSNRNAPH
jgi:L-histidine N-alpha-methyltransferase